MILSHREHIEGPQFELENFESDRTVSILSRDSRQPIIAKPQDGGGVLSDSSNGKWIQVEVSDVIWPFDKELYVIPMYANRKYLNKNIFN